MSRAKSRRPRAAARQKHPDEAQDTRGRLLEAAGQVFAEKGFDRARGREICTAAGTNAAAVNYYFGGMEGLYAAVLQEAHDRLFTLEKVSAAVAGKPDAKSKLAAFLGLVIATLTGPASSSWALRVVGREVIAPSPAFDALREKEILPKSRILKRIVGELMGLPVEHPAVARGCLSIIGPCIMLAIADRRLLKRALPQLELGPGGTAVVTRHMIQFAWAGLAAIAREERKRPGAR